MCRWPPGRDHSTARVAAAPQVDSGAPRPPAPGGWHSSGAILATLPCDDEPARPVGEPPPLSRSARKLLKCLSQLVRYMCNSMVWYALPAPERQGAETARE